MHASRRIKKKMLQALLSDWPGVWAVVGVTSAALLVFKEHSFRRQSRMGINRSHLIPRNETFAAMLDVEMPQKEWWEFYMERDKTVLATASENMSNRVLDFIPIEEDHLFVSAGYRWRHGAAEEQKLRDLHAICFLNGSVSGLG